MDLGTSEGSSSRLESQGNNKGTENENEIEEELLSPQSRKGVGLKKWKRIRIRRDPNSEDSEEWRKNLGQLGEGQVEGTSERERENSNSHSLTVESDSRNGECSVSGDEAPTDFEDPFFYSLCSLQVAQEALLQEIKKFGEIGNESFSPDDDDSTKCSSAVEEVKQISSSSLELQVLSLTENINILESKSDELQGMLALKDSRIAELEIALTGENFPKEESTCTIGLSDKFFEELESELQSLFRHKVEAEVEYLAITKMMQNLKVASAFTSLEKQETMSGSQVQVPYKLEEACSKGSKLKNRADELEKYCGDILGVEETYMIQRRVCKLTFCLFLQIMLLILVFWLVLSQLVPISGVVVPT